MGKPVRHFAFYRSCSWLCPRSVSYTHLEEEKRLIDEKMKQLPIKQYGAYFRKMAIDGYILVVDRSDTKAYIRELQAVSRNINQIAKRANATGTVYRQDIEDIKKAVDEIWRLQRRTLLNQP